MNKKNVFFCLLFLASWQVKLIAQEVLTDLSSNVAIANYLQSDAMHGKSLEYDTLELPFFDDFSRTQVFPDQNLWKDVNVFINSSFAVEPISLGVASFDALSGLGELYQDLDAYPKRSDYLTSQAINLNYTVSANVVLSFFVQPQGLGNAPEAGDSIMLEFLTRSNGWVKVWGLAGKNVTDFKQYFVPVNEERFLYKGFQFRFVNKVSLAGTSNPAAAANSDQWHLDYVELDKNRTVNDTIVNDVAFYAPSKPMLLKYSSMPWSHYRVAASAEFNSIYFNFRNNDYLDRNVSTIFTFYDKKHKLVLDSGFVEVENVLPYTLISKRFMLEENPFPPDFEDDAHFEIRTYLTTDGFDYAPNNKAVTQQVFKNYYSYDDGTPENGYGIESATGRLAFKFESYIADSLRAIDIFFNRTKGNASQQYFYLTVWNDNNGIPGQVIYQKQGIRPEYEAILNTFHRYLLDSAIAVNGVFYVGWVQTNDKNLNVGFDANLKAKNRIFYNTNGPWLQSIYSDTGSLMIRTVLGKPLNTGIEPLTKTEIRVYPNPAKDILHLDGLNAELDFFVFSIAGQKLLQGSTCDNLIDISGLTDGMYLLTLRSGSKVYNVKFSVAR